MELELGLLWVRVLLQRVLVQVREGQERMERMEREVELEYWQIAKADE